MRSKFLSNMLILRIGTFISGSLIVISAAAMPFPIPPAVPTLGIYTSGIDPKYQTLKIESGEWNRLYYEESFHGARATARADNGGTSIDNGGTPRLEVYASSVSGSATCSGYCTASVTPYAQWDYKFGVVGPSGWHFGLSGDITPEAERGFVPLIISGFFSWDVSESDASSMLFGEVRINGGGRGHPDDGPMLMSLSDRTVGDRICDDYGCYNDYVPLPSKGRHNWATKFMAPIGYQIVLSMSSRVTATRTGDWNPVAGFTNWNNQTGSLIVDPLIEIDPVWLASHTGYSLEVSEGVENKRTSPARGVPEPTTIALLVLLCHKRNLGLTQLQ